MIFKRTLVVALAGLLLGAFIIGCGASGDSPGSRKKSQEKSLSPQAKEHFKAGWKLLQEKKLPEALKEFQETTRLAPAATQPHLWMAHIYMQQKDFPQAEQAAKKALELDPKNHQALAMLGKIYSLDKSKWDQAQEYLEKALEYSPDNLGARFDLGRLYLFKGDRPKAFGEFTGLFAKEGEFAVYRVEMGRLQEALGDKKLALTHYQRAQVLNPKLAEAEQAVKRLSGTAAKDTSGHANPAPSAKPMNPGKKQPKQ